jgi:hypothetical protein
LEIAGNVLMAAATIVGIRHSNITMLRSFHRSLRYPVRSTTKTPTAPEGRPIIRASWLVYPKVVSRMLEKLLRPPLGILVSMTLNATSQTRISFMLSRTCSFLSFAFWVPDWFSFTLRSAAILSAGVNLTALTGESGRNVKTSPPRTMVMSPMVSMKIRPVIRLA